MQRRRTQAAFVRGRVGSCGGSVSPPSASTTGSSFSHLEKSASSPVQSTPPQNAQLFRRESGSLDSEGTSFKSSGGPGTAWCQNLGTIRQRTTKPHEKMLNISRTPFIFFQIFCLLVRISLSVSGPKREEYLAHVEPGISADTN